MTPYISINNRKIGPDFPPYVIAELSANHNGEIDRALKLLEEAKAAGADAIKLQTYTADTITIDHDSEEFLIEGGLWRGKTLYQLYQEAHMPWNWHEPLFQKANKLNLTIFSSPFDFTAVELLEQLDVPAYKIASFEIVDLPLIKRVAQTGKPLIISTGMANVEEIEEAINVAKNNGSGELIILHCVSGYPAPAKQYNLKTINELNKLFDVITGISDHTIDNATAIAAVALGACVIEKHFTLNRSDGGADDSFSIEPHELKQLCKDAKIAWQAIGSASHEMAASEIPNSKFRRSLYVVKDIAEGELLTNENIRSIRPGFGLSPKNYEDILGKKAKKRIKRGTPLNFSLFE